MTEEGADRIHIEKLEVWAHVGVPDSEREKPQGLTANITLRTRLSSDGLNDDVEKTIDYAAVCHETKKFAQDCSPKLLETLADGIARHLLALFPIRRVDIELRKFVLTDAAYASVRVIREAAPD